MGPSVREAGAEFHGMTVHQLEVLRRLLECDGMTMRGVADVLSVGPSGATQLVDRLEQRGLVTRERDPEDRRVQRVLPTQRARDAGSSFATRLRTALDDVAAVLDEDELRTYVELSERVAGADVASHLGERRTA
ncbi:MAG: MarR family transcriptional regulator [Candidatus Dormibacteraeota bacterium]|nr:MarR family transcriptional regulator [Candidatus Dormibacteraeota bacterium]